MTRKQLDIETKQLCVLAAIMCSQVIMRAANSIADVKGMNDEEKQNIAAEISGNIFAGTMYGVVCIANGIIEPTGEPLDGKGDITTRITQAILNNAFTIVNDELNNPVPYPSEN